MIEKYLAQEMTLAERHEVEKRIQLDPQFRTEVDEYKLAIEALKIAQRDELKNRFRQRDKDLDKVNTRFISHGRNLWMLAAVVTGIILFSWLFYYSFRAPAAEEIFTSQDSIQQEQILPVDMDSIKVAIPEKDPEVLKEEKNTKPAKRDKSKELFAANFEPYVDDSMDPMSRGDEEEMNELEKFQLYYWEKRYDLTVATFGNLNAEYRVNDNFKFIYANALMAVGRIDEAISILAEIISNGESHFSQEANYYIALGYLKKGNNDEAKKFLQVYLTEMDGMHKVQAKKILAEMDK